MSAKKIILISPAYRTKLLENVRVLALPPLSLMILARHTPPEYEVEIVDEAVEALDGNAPADLVGITCMTPLAPRAYAIAARFRARGIPVVIGGIHASMLPDEAAGYADAVVVGEGEELWPRLLADWARGALQQRYRADTWPDLENLPAPRRDLLRGQYFVQTVQTSRGCPHNCKFCSVTQFNGGRYRLRHLDAVIGEIEAIPAQRLFLIDDNIVGSGSRCIARAFALFDRLQHCRKEWAGQTCLNIVEHEGLLAAAAKSGARAFLIGFESLNADTVAAMNKKINLRPTTRNFKDAVRRIHDHGIAVVGGFMFGTDDDTTDTFARTLDFILDARLDAVQLSIQTPLPGTALYRQLADEKRLLLTNYPPDWEAYNVFEPVFQPKQMTPEALYAGLLDTYRRLSTVRTSLARGLRTFINTRSLFSTSIAFFWNHDSYRTLKTITRPRLFHPAAPGGRGADGGRTAW